MNNTINKFNDIVDKCFDNQASHKKILDNYAVMITCLLEFDNILQTVHEADLT